MGSPVKFCVISPLNNVINNYFSIELSVCNFSLAAVQSNTLASAAQNLRVRATDYMQKLQRVSISRSIIFCNYVMYHGAFYRTLF